MNTTNLTALELDVLKAIDASEYGDSLTDGVWSFSIAQNIRAGVAKRSIPGVVASLSKKGLVVVSGYGTSESYVTITDAGAAAYLKATDGTSNKSVQS